MKEHIPEGGFLGVVEGRVVWGRVENTSLCRPSPFPLPPAACPSCAGFIVFMGKQTRTHKEGSVGWICLTLSKGFLITCAWNKVAVVKIRSQLQPGLFCGINICNCP